MRRRSPIFATAVANYHACRAEYELYRESAFQRASDEISGHFLNALGKRRGIDPYSLFGGNEARALCYASEELVEHWTRYPRVTFEKFEAQWRPDSELAS